MGAIYDALVENDGIHLGGHFIYTSGVHVERYHNVRWSACDNDTMSMIASDMVDPQWAGQVDVVFGPETLGRTFVDRVGQAASQQGVTGLKVMWCQIVKHDDGTREVRLPDEEMYGFSRYLKPGAKVWIIDDVLSKGTTSLLVLNFLRAFGVEIVGVSAVLRLNQTVTAKVLGVPALQFLEDVVGVEMLSEAECQERGMCSRNEPIVLKPGHGFEYQIEHPDYPGGYVDLDR